MLRKINHTFTRIKTRYILLSCIINTWIKKECGICYITRLVGSIVYLECCHSLYRQCLKKIRKHKCPFCRHDINTIIWLSLVITQTRPQQSTEERILEISENTVIRRRKKRRKSKKSSIKSFYDKNRHKEELNVGEHELHGVKVRSYYIFKV